MDVADNADEALDPRIQIELENLNDATDDINKLETELDEAHTAFRQLLSETTKRLKVILNKVGNNCVEKARCYYEALEETRHAQIKCQEQAQLFQRASEIHAAAKETVALAESRFISHQHEWNFDQAWQDMLNHATLKVMDAENQKAECGREHYRRAVLFHDAEKRLFQLAEKHQRSIVKARPYFEIKAQCDQMLTTQKERVEFLKKAIQDAKTNYAASLRRLEEISNQIHQQRRDYDFIVNGPREPGVGAELDSPQKTANYDMEFSHLNRNEIKDITNSQMKKYNRIQNYDNTCQLQDDAEHLGKRSVDGSEATASQWELELEANVENLNNISLENSVLDRNSKSENVANLHFYNEGNTKSNDFSQELTYNCVETKDYSLQNSSRSKILQNFQIFKNPFMNLSSMTYFEESEAAKNEISDSIMSNGCKIDLKSTSKSLNSSPVKTNIFNLGSKFTEKGIYSSLAKYVPNNILHFGFSNNKSQSSNEINLPLDLDTNSVDKCQSLVNIVDNKTDTLEFDTYDTDLKHNMQSFTMKETDDNGLSPDDARNLQCAQVNNISAINLKLQTDEESTKNRLRSNSMQFVPSSVNSSPVKVKKIVHLSSENSSNQKLTSDCNESFSLEKTLGKRSNVNELPLLSLFQKDNSLASSKTKSFSMINLGEERDFLSLNDPNSVKTLSIERLTRLKDNLFSTTTR